MRVGNDLLKGPRDGFMAECWNATVFLGGSVRAFKNYEMSLPCLSLGFGVSFSFYILWISFCLGAFQWKLVFFVSADL